MTTTAIPATFEAITPAWLTGALRAGGQAGDASVAAVRWEPVGQGVGILCQLARFEIEYEGEAGGAPRTLIAKIPTTDPQTRHMVGIFKFYEREVRFYQQLAGQISIQTPRMLHGEVEPASGDFVLLLEDLQDARLGNQLEGCSVADAELTIREIARLHAAWWDSPRLDELTWMPASNDPIQKAGVALYPQAWPIFAEHFGDGLSAAMRATGERLGSEVGTILDRFADARRTICHGDLRQDNLFFAAGPEQPPLRVIDWQISTRATGTYDLGYFMSQSVATEVRRENEERILRMYLDLLREGGVQGYDYDQLIHDYRWTLLFCLAYPVMGGGLGDLSNERGRELVRTMRDRCAAAITDWDAGALLDS